ncbi:MAG: pilus assembly protein PilM [Planctomycetota bacterium]|jgi:Tfp pilus assembly protein PilN
MRAQTGLGIDISQDRINLALLRKNKDGVELLKAASGPVPDGAIKDGNIEDSAMLFKAVRELKDHNRIRASHAAVTLLTRPVLLQIIDVPRSLPTNIGQFVQDEIKHCVALSGREIAFDYCGIGSGGQAGGSRLFAVATDAQKVTDLARVSNQARLNVGAIEPPLLAYARAFYDKKIAGKFDCNVLMAVLQGRTLTLCVFRKQTLDFVRTKDISEERTGPDELCQWLAEQINAIIQFYQVEVSNSSGKWEVTVVADSVQLPPDTEESLKTKVPATNLQVRAAEDAYQDTPIGQNDGSDRPSAVAIGLAMKLLDMDGSNLRINLIPPETAEVKALRKDLLIIANIAMSLLVLMIFIGWGFNAVTGKIKKRIIQKRQTQSSRDTYALFREQTLVEKQIKQLSDRPDLLSSISSSRPDVDWAGLFNDIRKATPKTLRITDLLSKGQSKMSLEGLAVSYEAVHLFVDMLNKSDRIETATVLETEKDRSEGGLVRYSINCALAPRKEG